MNKTFVEWLDYLNSLYPREIDLGLERVASIAKKNSLEKFSCPVITVGGTNGKGSVVRFLESIYLAAGYRVAAYTSPHLLRFNERLRINGQEITDDEFVDAFECIEQSRGNQSLTFFEFTTLAALLICQRRTLDVIILEVGLGGRLDAVNIVNSDVAVITSIAIDHTDWLGPDRDSIGREKAGIFREGKPAVCGDPNPPNVVREIAQSLQSPWYGFCEQFSVKIVGANWEWRGPHLSYCQLPLPELKLQNAAMSLMVVDLLQSRVPVTQYAVIRGLKTACLPGRWERATAGSVPVIFDVAHNPQATTYLAEQLSRAPSEGRTLAVVGMLKDKDIKGSLSPLLPLVSEWYTASLNVPRGASGADLATCLATHGVECCYNFASVETALAVALERCCSNDRILVFGSFYTVGIAKQYLESLF